ncbi:class II aldolase/adducin family protein [Alicyclobacillus fodiniaquatilis]|uniref:Class II aldolase/adducin family protein n=1 Tax=Alicyclobacillus fodiniaquatilis TaxID=1661150 RepID=A0ABW4JM95_9BACL
MEASHHREVVQSLISVGRYMMENQLAWGNSGNISARTGETKFCITASGTYLGELEATDFIEVDVQTDALYGVGKPSKEVPMHTAIYESRPDVGAILHASPFYSTMFACTKEPLPNDWFVEDFYYLERIARVPYFHPGSVALGEAVREQARVANILLLENHGVLVYDTTIREARMALQTLEMVAKMAVYARMSQLPMEPVGTQVVADFLDNAGYKPRRRWPT